MPTEDQIEAARTKVRNMLHAADHGNHLGEMAVLRMAASGELLEAAKLARAFLINQFEEPGRTVFWRLMDALSLAQPYEAEVVEGRADA
ncbi:MAG: hypothetical protein JWQ97_974 [Phenylobacterium sp.]|nr:hypothetical protein [Phenylobacterium sp.]